MSQRPFRGAGGYRGGGRRSHPYHRPSNEDVKTDQPPQEVLPYSVDDLEGAGGGGGGGGAGVGDQDGARREKKFSNRARLFVGNLPRDFNDQHLKKLFEEFGEVKEVFVKKDKNFGFVRMGYRSECEKAIASLNGKVIKQRDIKVRFAASSCSVKVSNLNPVVSNELLEEAFSQFGEVESAVVVTDDRGKPLGHGIVDFARKTQAINAIQQCRNEHFLITASPIPVLVTEWVRDNDEDGLPEHNILKNSQYSQDRELPPRFAPPGSFEYSVASRWKEQYDIEASQREELEKSIKQTRYQIQHGMAGIKEQHKTMLLRQELAHHHEQQVRLEQKLRQREERHMLIGNQGGGGGAGADPPVPLFPAMGGPGGSAEHDAEPPNGPPSFPQAPLYPQFPPSMVMPFAPPPLMGQAPNQALQSCL